MRPGMVPPPASPARELQPGDPQCGIARFSVSDAFAFVLLLVDAPIIQRCAESMEFCDAPFSRSQASDTHDTRYENTLADIHRSEEHTSELQSLMRISYAVFCLKKKNTDYTQRIRICTNKKNSI